MFQEKFELSRRIEMLRAELANVIDMRVLVPRVLAALEDSRRVTHASIYLADPDGSGFELAGHVGPAPRGALRRHRPPRVLRAAAPHGRHHASRASSASWRRAARCRTRSRRACSSMLRTLDQMNGSVALGFSSEDQLLGALVIRDERLREAYSSDEIELFRGVATSIGITLQNSQVYERMKERDRLAALGEMAAGLAHEIRNPLGAIKGAAQLLQPRPDRGEPTARGHARVPRHHRRGGEPPEQVVSRFLDYARPYRGEQRQLRGRPTVVRKTLQLLAKEAEAHGKVEIVPTSPTAAAGARRRRAAAPGVPEPVARTRCRRCPNGGTLVDLDGAAALDAPARAAAQFLEVRFRDTGRRHPAPAISRTCSSRSTPPRRRAPASGCRSASASSSTTAARSRCARSRARARRSRCCCRSRPTSTPSTQPSRPRRRGRARGRRRPPAAPGADAAAAAARARCRRPRPPPVPAPARGSTPGAADRGKLPLRDRRCRNRRQTSPRRRRRAEPAPRARGDAAPRRLRGRHRGERRRGARAA